MDLRKDMITVEETTRDYNATNSLLSVSSNEVTSAKLPQNFTQIWRKLGDKTVVNSVDQYLRFVLCQNSPDLIVRAVAQANAEVLHNNGGQLSLMQPVLSSSTARLPQDMGLLRLPLEVLQLCLIHSTTPSFLQLIATCHMFWDLASNSRAVILHHLAQVPGIKLGIDDLTTSTPNLFLTLRRRACLNLFGAHMRADRTDYTFPNSSFNASASCLWAGKRHGMALVANDVVRLYTTTPKRGLVRKGLTVPGSKLCVLKSTADESGDVTVLYGQSATTAGTPGTHRSSSLLMVSYQWRRNSYQPVVYYNLEDCKGYVPISLAATKRNKMAIAVSRGSLSHYSHSNRPDMAVICYVLERAAGIFNLLMLSAFSLDTDPRPYRNL
jgi:hypothetical protein